MLALIALLTALASPCEYEDQMTPCTWNASTQGNGMGNSFMVLSPDTIIYF